MGDNHLKKPAFDPMNVEAQFSVSYPPPSDEMAKKRMKWKLDDAVSLKTFGIHLVHLKPRQGSSQRRWHTKQIEFIYVLESVAKLNTEEGEQPLAPGTCPAFPPASHERPPPSQQVRHDDHLP